MKYVIMCVGNYNDFVKPKALSVVNGEPLVQRTIRLLKDNGVDDICITSLDKRFDRFGVPRLEHNNNFSCGRDGTIGYWLNAFYPNFDEKDTVTYLFGDVYFTDEAIKKIVNSNVVENTLFGTSIAKNKQHKNWGEPFAYKVVDYKAFLNGIENVKKLYDGGTINRHPLVWELYRFLNNLDINIQNIVDNTYICIDDGTIDVDAPWQINEMNRRMEK